MSRSYRKQWVIEGPLAPYRRFGGKHGATIARTRADELDAQHGSAVHGVIEGEGDRYGWRRTQPLPWETE